MNSKLFNVLTFIVGAAVGSAITWKFLKTKYEKIAQDEIDSVKEVYFRHTDSTAEKVEDESDDEPEHEEDQRGELKRVVTHLGYTSWDQYIDESNRRKEDDEPMPKDGPYVIPPENFGDADDYDCISLNYYADGVLTDDWDNPIEDVEGMVGKESLTHFGEYEDDSVFVRNDRMKADFEILLDERNYSDVVRDSASSEE